MDISNRTLGLLLIAAIVVSIGSTFFMLNSISMAPGFSATGYLTSDDGTVDLDIDAYISIVVNDSVIDFGTCSLNTTLGATTTFDSNLSKTSANNSLCDMSWTDSDYLVVENDGTIDVNLSVVSSIAAGTLYKDSANVATTANSKYQIMTTGTACTTPVSYTDLGTSSVDVCTTLAYADADDQLTVFAKVVIDNTAKATGAGAQATWTFTASN